jgi:hypothetical protein
MSVDDTDRAAIAAFPELRRLVDLRRADWRFTPGTDAEGQLRQINAVRTWPGGYADALLVRYTTDAAGIRCDHAGGCALAARRHIGRGGRRPAGIACAGRTRRAPAGEGHRAAIVDAIVHDGICREINSRGRKPSTRNPYGRHPRHPREEWSNP